MRRLIYSISICAALVPSVHASSEIAELHELLHSLRQQVNSLENRVAELTAEKETPPQLAATRERSGIVAPALDDGHRGAFVNLDLEEQASIAEPTTGHVLANPWWRNIEIHGFAAAGIYDTGTGGTRNHGGFEIKEATLFIEADIWRDTSLFVELQTNRLGKDDQVFTRTGEVYLHFRDIPLGDAYSFGMKTGRIDIPFGEEYLWQDSIDNPLITTSAAYPYGFDEGLLIYSSFKGINWIAAVTDGTDARSIEDDSEKAWNVKLYGDLTDELYLSLSFMSNGEAAKSAFEFGGSHFQPVGASHQSSTGSSSSDSVDAILGQIDAKYSFVISPSLAGYIALSVGAAEQSDDQSIFDRDILWFSVEPSISYNHSWYGVVRYSEIGSYDDDEGYHFDGKTFAGGNSAFGYDTRTFSRLGVGIGWVPHPNLRAKFEVGKDWFDLIHGSLLSENNSERSFMALEVSAKF